MWFLAGNFPRPAVPAFNARPGVQLEQLEPTTSHGEHNNPNHGGDDHSTTIRHPVHLLALHSQRYLVPPDIRLFPGSLTENVLCDASVLRRKHKHKTQRQRPHQAQLAGKENISLPRHPLLLSIRRSGQSLPVHGHDLRDVWPPSAGVSPVC